MVPMENWTMQKSSEKSLIIMNNTTATQVSHCLHVAGFPSSLFLILRYILILCNWTPTEFRFMYSAFYNKHGFPLKECSASIKSLCFHSFNEQVFLEHVLGVDNCPRCWGHNAGQRGPSDLTF